MIIIRHTHLEGTLVEGTSRGSRSNNILKTFGFRWFPSIKMWGLRGSRDHMARRYVIERAAEALHDNGLACEIQIDDTPRETADRENDRAERVEDRQEALDDKGERLRAKGDSAYAGAKQLMDQIPFGQPILVDHYSARRARKDQERIQRGVSKAVENWEESATAEGKADASRRHQHYRETGPVTQRRIDRIEAELRVIARNLERARNEQATPQTHEWEMQLTQRQEMLTGDLIHWKEHLRDLIDTGQYKPKTRVEFAPGDIIETTFGQCTVIRVNPKTLTVQTQVFPDGMHTKIGYDQVRAKVSA